MTNEEAIKAIKWIREIFDIPAYQNVALDKAIEALRYCALQKDYRDRMLNQDLDYFGDNHNW